jgi:hypothetical protein
MIWKLKDLLKHCNSVHRKMADGTWVPAKPMAAPFSWRLRAAWEVVRGRADAFTWPNEV